MVYEDWWGHYKKSIPYYMFCTPNRVFAKGGVRDNVKYDFEFITGKRRGYDWYIQRMWKGVGYGYRQKGKWGDFE